MTNKEKFIGLFRELVQRDGVEKLISMLEKSDFFTAPASTQYHDSCEGGLCDHSLKVYKHMVDECTISNMIVSLESIVVVSLLHDLCKVGFYTVSSRNVKNAKGIWEQVAYYSVDDKLPLGHGEKSVIMIMEFMKLSTEEMMAIRWHMGGYEAKENYQALSKAYGEFPLAVLLHLSDMKATYIK